MEQRAETVMASDTEMNSVWSRDILLSWLEVLVMTLHKMF